MQPSTYQLPAGKVLMIRTCKSDGSSFGGFQWPTSGPVAPPRWNPDPESPDGLFGLEWGVGDTSRYGDRTPYGGGKWLVVETDAGGVVNMRGKHKFASGNVVLCCDSCTDAYAFLLAYAPPALHEAIHAAWRSVPTQLSDAYQSGPTMAPSPPQPILPLMVLFALLFVAVAALGYVLVGTTVVSFGLALVACALTGLGIPLMGQGRMVDQPVAPAQPTRRLRPVPVAQTTPVAVAPVAAPVVEALAPMAKKKKKVKKVKPKKVETPTPQPAAAPKPQPADSDGILIHGWPIAAPGQLQPVRRAK